MRQLHEALEERAVLSLFPHIPLAAWPRSRNKSPLGLYGDTIEEVDWNIGQILTRRNRRASIATRS